ncbi:hypothetical protein ACO0LG_10525 [Undibacterium sp. Ji42W]|uniref:hypothetical protein n=1 Tax=Undibacterium sp. Ji42W TaxID=3413039 RepID=UPI003BF0BD66
MTTPNFTVLVHVEDKGDLSFGPDQFAGDTGKIKALEGFQITFPPASGLGLRYMAHVSKNGDTGWVNDGEFVGNRGKRLPVEGFAIEVNGDKLAKYDIFYMAYFRDGAETAWFSNGAFCGSRGQSRAIDGIIVRLALRAPNYVSIISKAKSVSGKPLLITLNPVRNELEVSVRTDDDLQTWEKRMVKAGQGYALINKAKPNLCIARGQGMSTELKDVSQIDKNDACVWRDDNVAGLYNAINSWTNWELKLNISGNYPYRDQGNTLLAYPWAAGADNELWRTAMRTYNVVAGSDEIALNRVSEAIYHGCYPQVFKESIDVGDKGITTVGFDIATVPVFSLQPSQLYQQQLENQQDLPEERKAWLTAANSASFSLRVDEIRLNVGGGIAAEVHATLDASALIHTNPEHGLTIHLNAGVLHLPGQQMDEHLQKLLEASLNQVFLPLLLNHLNKNILDHIAIPALELNGIPFANPVISSQPPYILASTSILPDSVNPPFPQAWPRGRLFCGVDANALDAAAASVLKDFSIDDKWRTRINFGILGSFDISARYELKFKNPNFTVTARSGNTYKLKIDISGYADFAIGVVNPGAGGDGFAQVTASVDITSDNKVRLIFQSLDAIVVNWHFNGLPGWMDIMISGILNAFDPVVMAAVRLGLGGKTFDLYTIPEINATIAGKKFEITLENLGLSSTEDPTKKALLLAEGGIKVRIK